MTHWKFDLTSSVITVIVLPVVTVLCFLIRRYFKEWLLYIAEGLLIAVGHFINHSVAAALTLRRYCRLRLAGENRYLHVPSSLDVKLEVDKVYVALTLDIQGSDKGTYSHADLLTVGNRIRVIGDPGSGKSSLVKRLYRDECYRALRRPRAARLPILIELRTIDIPARISQAKLSDWLLNHAAEQAAKAAAFRMDTCFETYCKGPGLLILLDGLDEVANDRFERIVTAIMGLSEKLSLLSENNVVVLTMRTQLHQQIRESFRGAFGQALFVRPFTPTDIHEFLTRWPFHKDSASHTARIYKDLTDRPTLREMCSNPLILAMYVAEDQAATHLVAPESRTEFYKKVADELIIKRRLQQVGSRPGHAKLREQRERILGRLAYDHMIDRHQPSNSLSFAEALRIVEEVSGCKKEDAESVFMDISRETGLLSQERPKESFRFIHLTFCEFLAAFEAVQGQEGGWEALVAAHDSFLNSGEPQLAGRLVEVLPFACGLLPRIRRGNALSDLGKFCDLGLLARCFLETKLYDHDSWPIFVKYQSESLTYAPDRSRDEAWLKSLHLFNIVIRDAEQCAAHMPGISISLDLETFLRGLTDQKAANLGTIIAAYASHDAAAAFRIAELSHIDLLGAFPYIVIDNCDQAPFLALVTDAATKDTTRTVRWSALLSEAGLRSRVVANALHAMPPNAVWAKFIDALPPRSRWFRGKVLRESFYTQCVTLATMAPPDGAEGTFALLNILRQAPPPSDIFWSQRLLPGLICFCIFVTTMFGFGGTPNIPRILAVNLAIILSSFRANELIINEASIRAIIAFPGAYIFLLFSLQSFSISRVYRGLLFVGSNLSLEIPALSEVLKNDSDNWADKALIVFLTLSYRFSYSMTDKGLRRALVKMYRARHFGMLE